jgi:hypothetical protein
MLVELLEVSQGYFIVRPPNVKVEVITSITGNVVFSGIPTIAPIKLDMPYGETPVIRVIT